jgi:hypothetical protein
VSLRLRPIGGEPEGRAGDAPHTYLVDSGRSALRLILGSGFAAHRFLLPDYVCDVVPKVFDDLGVSYGIYRVNPDLSIDADSIAGRSYDVLYVVNYFGCRARYREYVGTDTWVIEDCVFQPLVNRPRGVGRWIGFNSLRKVTPLADGSLVKSTVALDESLIRSAPGPFVDIKSRAKALKRACLRDGSRCESIYLDLFQRGEQALDRQTSVHAMSSGSLCNLFDILPEIDSEYRARRENFRILDARLHRYALGIDPQYPCLYVLSAADRDALRQHLFERRVFLPVHWPNVRGSENPLYRTVISIPVDSRYGADDMQRVAAAIDAFYERRPGG